MKYILTSAVLLIALSACGPSPEPGGEIRTMQPATNLEVVPQHRQLIVSWDPLADASFNGYNIYVVPEGESLENAAPHNTQPFPGDTSPDDNRETYEAGGLENGVVYTVWVTAVYPGQRESRPTRQVRAVCGGRGETTLGVRYDSENDGFSFANNEIVRADSDANDLYYVSVGGIDYLASPTRLDGFLRSSLFLVLPYEGDLETVAAAVEKNRPEATEPRVVVSEGDWVLLRTTDGAHALLQIRSIEGNSDDDKTVTFFYAYSSLTDRVMF